jgi:hypothetical protein
VPLILHLLCGRKERQWDVILSDATVGRETKVDLCGIADRIFSDLNHTEVRLKVVRRGYSLAAVTTLFESMLVPTKSGMQCSRTSRGIVARFQQSEIDNLLAFSNRDPLSKFHK